MKISSSHLHWTSMLNWRLVAGGTLFFATHSYTKASFRFTDCMNSSLPNSANSWNTEKCNFKVRLEVSTVFKNWPSFPVLEFLYCFQRYHFTIGSGMPSAKHFRVILESSLIIIVPTGVDANSSSDGGTWICARNRNNFPATIGQHEILLRTCKWIVL